MPRFENIMDILVVGSAGAASMLHFPDDFDMTMFAEQLRMLDKLKEQQAKLNTFVAFDEDGKVTTTISTTGTGKSAW